MIRFAAKISSVLFVSIASLHIGSWHIASSAMAQDRKGIRLWNLTLHTITSLRMSPAGEGRWGPDQCQNDRDGTVEHDERLRITGITAGRYDVNLVDETGRTCIVRNIEVRDGAVFLIEEKQLTECGH
jgi:hypothetical protein